MAALASGRIQSDTNLASSLKPSPDARSISPLPQSIDDRATTSYIRRTLCAHHAISSGPPRSIHDLLPPLTSRNDVDLQLYAIIAVVLKEFVQSWYGKITPDHDFVDEILRIVAHCTRALEERIRNVDLEALILDEIPRLVDAHVTAFRIAHQPLQPYPLANSPRRIYHTLHPHPALSPVPDPSDASSIAEQDANEQAWRQLLAQSVLTVLLPTEDLQNDCLRSLVGQILAEMIVGNIIGTRICESWALWGLITNAIEVVRAKGDTNSSKPKSPGSGITDAKRSKKLSDKYQDGSNTAPIKSGMDRLEQYGLLNSPNRGKSTGKEVATGTTSMATTKLLTNAFWTLLHYGITLITAGRAVAVLLLSSGKLDARGSSKVGNFGASPTAEKAEGAARSGVPKAVRPILDMMAWKTVANLIELPSRMPWLSGLASLAHWTATSGPGKVGEYDGRVDRLLSHLVHSRLLNPALLPPLLRSIRRHFFPSNTFPRGPPKRAPEPPAIVAAKQRCAEAIVDVMPPLLRSTYLASTDRDAQLTVVEGWLDVLGDPYLNRHLVFSVLEVCLVRVLPELADKGPKELMEERLGPVVGGS